MLKLIQNNPFRILGAYTNTSLKDVLAMANKLKAYCKVGKDAELPLDYIDGLPNVERTIQSIDSSLKALDFDSDRLVASLFWFIWASPTDLVALKHLEKGNQQKALEIWCKVRTVSSYHNRALLYLILGDYENFVLSVNHLFSELCEEYSELLETTQSTKELLKTYLDAIEHDNPAVIDNIFKESPKIFKICDITLESGDFEILSVKRDDCTRRIRFKNDGTYRYVNISPSIDNISNSQILDNKEQFVIEYSDKTGTWLKHINDTPALSDLWLDTLYSILGQRLIKRIEMAIGKAHSIDSKRYLERKESAVTLVEYLKDSRLRRVLSSGLCKTIRGKAVKEALQCIIDYYNNATDQDEVVEEAYNLTFSLSFDAHGTIHCQRVKDNQAIFKKHLEELPPKSIRYYDTLLTARIKEYENEPSTISHALRFIRDCAPYLMSIKAVIGETHNYYVNVSTRVAAMVVNDVIDDFNKQSDDILPRIKNVSFWEKQKLIEQFKSLVTTAATAMYQLTFFAMEDSYKNQRFQKNYDIIKKQAIDCGAITPLRPECSVVVNINGKYKSCSKFEDFLPELDTRDEDAYFNSCKTVEDCNHYLLIFPNGKFSSSIESKVEECTYNDCDTLAKLDEFVKKYPNTKLNIEAKRERIIFNSCKSTNDYRMYLSKYPSGAFVQKAKQKIDDLSFAKCSGRLDYQKYLTDFPKGKHYLEALRIIDDIDFKECHSIADFENYLKSHPHGCHVDEANSRIDDLTFAACSDEQGYSEYLRRFPSGNHVSEVNKILEDYRFWHNCETSKSRKLYKEYVAKFPNGRFRKEADKRLKSWWRDALQKGVSNKNTSITLAVIIAILVVIGLIWGLDGYKGLLIGIGCISGLGVIGTFFDIFKGEWKPFVSCLIVAAIGLGGGFGWDEAERYYERQQKAREKLDEAINSGNIYQLYYFLHDYSDTKWADEAYSLLYEKSKASGWKETIEFAGTYSDNEWGKSAYSVATQKCDSIFNASGLNYMSESDEYRTSLDSLRNGSYKPLISLIENLEWENEETAWTMAVKNNTIDFYNKFIEKYPSSNHVAQAEKRIIDLEVNNVFSSSYDELPSMNRSGYSNSSTSTIRVYNNTSYTLTVMYSGKESKKVVISPQGKVYVTLPNGIYKCVASISGNARNHAGTENLDGGSYEVEYYIVSTSYPSYRHY